MTGEEEKGGDKERGQERVTGKGEQRGRGQEKGRGGSRRRFPLGKDWELVEPEAKEVLSPGIPSSSGGVSPDGERTDKANG